MYDATPGPEAGDRQQDACRPPAELLWWRRLLYRWFVEYNPSYLLSAALVLLGMILASRGIAAEWTLAGQVGVAAVAELYAFALIGGAALLMRLRLPRPAVILGLLAVLYQGDLTLHTETSAFLSNFGAIASIAWLAIFVAKLYALAWALKLRLSRSALAVPILGAVGLALIPHLLREAQAGLRAPIVGWWVFVLFSAALWTLRSISSPDLLGSAGLRGRRSLAATWIIWGMLTMVHVLFWVAKFRVHAFLGLILPIAMLLSTRWIRNELAVWSTVIATLLLAYWGKVELFPTVALMCAVTLTLHALRQPVVRRLISDPPACDPYRTPASANAAPPVIETETVFELADKRAMARLLTGAVFGLYFALWSGSMIAGAPGHIIPLDAALTVVVAFAVWKGRAWFMIAPAAALWMHLGVDAGVVTAPVTMLQWGVSLVGGGFALLALSLAATLHLRKRHDPVT